MADQGTILVADSDSHHLRLMDFLFSDEGYHVITCTTLHSVLESVTNRLAHVIILDDLLDSTCFQVVQEMRTINQSCVVFVLSRRGAIADKVRGLGYGADYYLTKPFDHHELVLRIRNIFARYHSTRVRDAVIIAIGDAVLDMGKLTFHDRYTPPVVLTPIEAKILRYLMKRNGFVVNRATMHEAVWGYDPTTDYNRIDVNLGRIRRKIESSGSSPKYIHTYRKVGYMFYPETP